MNGNEDGLFNTICAATGSVMNFVEQCRKESTSASRTGMARGPAVATVIAATGSLSERVDSTQSLLQKLKTSMEKLDTSTNKMICESGMPIAENKKPGEHS